jgi:competence protein ComEA
MNREQFSRIAFVTAFSLFVFLVYYYLSKQPERPLPGPAVRPPLEPEPVKPARPAARQAPTSRKINLNTASADELTALTGIGPALAKAIVGYRQKTKTFNSIEELRNVKGIGPALFAKIKNRIAV